MQSIRFYRHGGPEVLQVDEVPRPVPTGDELLVQVEAAGVNYADTVRRWGDHYPISTTLPAICGGEVVGTVVDAAPGATRALVGQRVVAAPPSGGYAEFVCVREGNAFSVPAGLASYQALALFIQGLSAALILTQSGRLAAGESVFIEGAAGGVGSLAVQLARLYGAGRVIGAAGSPEKRARVLALGADAAIDYGRPGWSSEVHRLTEGRGVDVVMEMTGGDVFREAMLCLAPAGRVVVYGIASRKPFQVPSERLISSAWVVAGFYLGYYLRDRPLIDRTLEQFARFVADGLLKTEVDVLPLSQATVAHQRLESRQSSAKILLIPGR